MIKIIIACNDENNLLPKLKSNNQIALTKIKMNVADITRTCKSTIPDMLILDCDVNKLNVKIIIEKIYKLFSGKYFIVTVTKSKVYFCFDKINILLDLIKSLENFNDTNYSMLEESISDMLWKLHFNIYTKGAVYLKEAIISAYKNKDLLYDTNRLIKELSILHSTNEKNIRNNIDNALSYAFREENLQYDIDFFNGYYDGRKVSLKYFIALAVYYIDIEINGNTLNTTLELLK